MVVKQITVTGRGQGKSQQFQTQIDIFKNQGWVEKQVKKKGVVVLVKSQ